MRFNRRAISAYALVEKMYLVYDTLCMLATALLIKTKELIKPNKTHMCVYHQSLHHMILVY